MRDAPPFERIAILGTGLIGGSFGLAVHRAHPGISITAFDKSGVLEHVASLGLNWKGATEIGAAVRDADLIYISLPIGAALEVLPQIASMCDSQALVTDAGSTKTTVSRLAESEFKGRALFLGGHPIAGKESSGITNANADLFRGTRYVLIGNETNSDERIRKFSHLVQVIGAEPVWTDAETHDWAMAVVSQVPQLVTVALSHVLADETDETGMPVFLAGRGLRDLMRIAGSPYGVWRDICLTNTENIVRTLDRVSQAIDFIRSHLATRDLENEFRVANEVYKKLQDLQ